MENARIRLDVPKSLLAEFCGAKSFWAISDRQGNFIFEEHCGIANRTVIFYVVPPTDDNSQTPVYPPFDGLRDRNINFAGLSVIINGNEKVNLGDVPVQIYYNTIDLFILDKTGKPYFKNKSEWAKLKLVVKEENENVAGSEAISTRDYRISVNKEKGAVSVSLPEGKWQLELLKSWDDYDNENGKTKRFLAKTTVTIKKSEPTLPVRLIVKKGN